MSSNYTQFKGNNPFGSQAKMLYHTDRIYEYVTKGDTWPIFVEFNLTDICNLRCSWCISENCRSHDTIDLGVANQFLSDFSKHGGKAVTLSGGGEPTLHPNFLQILESAYNYGLDVGLMTNGVFPARYLESIDRMCRWVRFSLDTVNHDLYKKWKGIDRVDQVILNATKLYHTKVGINVNVGEEHTIEDVERLINMLYNHVKYIQFRPILPRYFCTETAQVNEKVWAFLHANYDHTPGINLSDDKFDDLTSDNLFPFTSCEGHFFNPVVQANGDLAVCMYHPKDSKFVFGNLNKKRFHTIWRSKKREDVIDNLRELDYGKSCQICCKLTELNKFIDFIRYPSSEMDINFL